jgi:hypothetical protein
MNSEKRTLNIENNSTVSASSWTSRVGMGSALTIVAILLVIVVLPPSRDAVNGIVTVYSLDSKGESLASAKYKAVIDAQAVIEFRSPRHSSNAYATTIGFDNCAVYDRKNWRCTRSGQAYLMQKGRLSVQASKRKGASKGIYQVDRLTWWMHRLAI